MERLATEWRRLKVHFPGRSAIRTEYYRLRYRNVVLGPGTRVQGRFTVTGAGRVRIGPGCQVARAAIHLLDRKAHVTIGRDCFLNGTDIVACERVTIGDRCLIGDTDIFETDFHSVQQRPGGKPRTGPITIGDDVWIAAKTAVLRGTTIGDRSVVGYGSVVSGDIPADHVARPSPLRVSAIAGLPSSAGRV